MKCPHASSCALFQRFVLNSALRFWQQRFCDADHESCERFKMSTLGRPVPDELLPNGASLPTK